MDRTKRGRRQVMLLGISALASALARPAIAVPRSDDRRRLSFHNLHTGESLDAVYWAGGDYVPDALKRIDTVLRDFRTGDVHPIDRRLLDLLVRLRQKLGTGEPVQVISGYRSPRTNAMLHAHSEGVASHSLHMDGMAIDIRVPGRALRDVRAAALDLAGGGVGYYPASDFVHVDVGRVRRWN
ncbi:MAG TPA: DUF882 domain-containing protein [Stellaceae bacterium]|nr:DUF882 domain-containing protein [Stellaceae bacterium]